MRRATAPGSTTDPTPTATRLVAHVVPEYLPRSATFIHTLLSHQTRHVPLVLTQAISHLDEFPLDRVEAHGAGRSGLTRLGEAGRALVQGHGSAYPEWIADRASLAECDLIHAHFGWSGRDAVPAARRLGVPLVTTFYGRDLSEATRARLRNPYRRLFAEGDAFVVEGPAMADHLAAVGCPADRIRIVPIGIALEQFPFRPPAARRPLVVVQTGRFVEKKGFDVGVEAFAAARGRLGESELWLIGDGPLRDELEARVDRLGVRPSVRFAGMVSHDEYRQLMGRADVCLQPSRTAADGDTEGGAPTVILEMQALGIRVVATRHADIPFVVARPAELRDEGDVDGIADQLVAVAEEDEAVRQARAEEARAFVAERHSAVVTAAAVETVYDEVLA
jgi:colanic acid/amylovoran biosynthesis glycosyltransferase